MSETVLYITSLLLSMLVGFLLGIICNNKQRGLAGSSGVCDKLSDSIEGSKERVADSESKLGGIIEAGKDVEAILRKYSDSTSENKDAE